MIQRYRFASVALAAAGVLFLLYPVFRPWHDESTLEGARASIGSGAWVASHLFAMLGFVLVPLGLLALHRFRLGLAAAVVTWIGAGLTLPYYGAEDFGLYAVAHSPGADLVGIAEAFRYNTVAATMFAIGLITLGIGAVLAAVAVWRSGELPRLSAIPFALGFVLFLPQFFAPPAARIAHGVLMAAGCLWLATALWTRLARR
ncbi:hypothetical protein [Allorhizocola rhizosphaerae]|uniref:hypothetical protein n=1 Tax=Allorhizocola rhizosphaerae TaxID=1872709 RepID=UPI000E3C318E|nr:hypothetical protein [Allorhizocola rhizosphaerae]